MESNADSPYIRLPDGVLRDVKIDLPPGFVGDPNATSKKCTSQELHCYGRRSVNRIARGLSAPELVTSTESFKSISESIFNMVPPRGVALQLGGNFFLPLLYINNGVLAGGTTPFRRR